MGTSGTESCEGCLWTQFKIKLTPTSTTIVSQPNKCLKLEIFGRDVL